MGLRLTESRVIHNSHVRAYLQVTALGFSMAVLIVALLALAVLYADLRRQVDVACHGVVAELDLTEWVQVCRNRPPERT